LQVACTRIKLVGKELDKVVASDAIPAVKAAAGYLFHEIAYGDVAHNLKLLYQMGKTLETGNDRRHYSAYGRKIGPDVLLHTRMKLL